MRANDKTAVDNLRYWLSGLEIPVRVNTPSGVLTGRLSRYERAHAWESPKRVLVSGHGFCGYFPTETVEFCDELVFGA